MRRRSQVEESSGRVSKTTSEDGDEDEELELEDEDEQQQQQNIGGWSR